MDWIKARRKYFVALRLRFLLSDVDKKAKKDNNKIIRVDNTKYIAK